MVAKKLVDGLPITRVRWRKTPGGRGFPLGVMNLSKIGTAIGLYVIYVELPGSSRAVIYVGEGKIRHRLQYHRSRKSVVTRYATKGTLRVVWAEVPKHKARYFETYLWVYLRPMEGDCWPCWHPINLPWRLSVMG